MSNWDRKFRRSQGYRGRKRRRVEKLDLGEIPKFQITHDDRKAQPSPLPRASRGALATILAMAATVGGFSKRRS